MKDWQWFGHAAHLIVGDKCRFHLATLLPNGYLVSTVGEYWPDRVVREIHAKIHDPKWFAENQHRKGDEFDAHYMERFGYETVGCDRKYETYVFAANPKAFCPCGCGLPKIDDYSELDALPANDAITARANHMKLCQKWARKKSKAKAA